MLVDVLNENLAKNIGGIETTILKLLEPKNDMQIESLLTEFYFQNKIQKTHFSYSTNWWIVKAPNKYRNGWLRSVYDDYMAINVTMDGISEFDKAFAKTLIDGSNIPVLHIVYHRMHETIEFILEELDGKSYVFKNEKDLLIELEINKENSYRVDKEHEPKDEKTKQIINWFCHTINESEFVYNELVITNFISKYFYGSTNLDTVVYDNNKNMFYIIEQKRKSNNFEHTFLINAAEFQKLSHIALNNEQIELCFLITVSSTRENRNQIVEDIMQSKDIAMFIYEPTNEQLVEIRNNIRVQDHDNGQHFGNTNNKNNVNFLDMLDFRRINNLAYIKDNDIHTHRINEMIRRMQEEQRIYNILDDNNGLDEEGQATRDEVYQLRIRQAIILNYMFHYGYDVDYEKYVYSNDFYNSVITINGKRILFKFFDKLSWNFLLDEKQYNQLDEIDYVLGFKIKSEYARANYEDLTYTYDSDGNKVYSFNLHKQRINTPDGNTAFTEDDEMPYDLYLIKASELKANLMEFPTTKYTYNQTNVNKVRWAIKNNGDVNSLNCSNANGMTLNGRHWFAQTICKEDGKFADGIDVFTQIDIKRRTLIYPQNNNEKIIQKIAEDKERKRREIYASGSFLRFAKDYFVRNN